MTDAAWPTVIKIVSGIPEVEAHYRGSAGAGGHYSFERSPGAAWRWRLTAAPMVIADALAVRAFLHSLRGAYGAIAVPLPARTTEAGAVDGAAATLASYTDGTDYSDSVYSDYVAVTGVVTGVTPGVVAANYDDDTDFDDDTAYLDDLVEIAAEADAATITVSGFSVGVIRVGGFMTVQTALGAQLVRVVSVAANTIGIRPRLRSAAASGAAVAYGRVIGRFRLTGNPPRIPLILGRSRPFDIELEEVY